MHTWTTTVAVLFVCSLVHSGYATVILAPYQEANCTQIEAHGNNLQEVLINISLAEPSDECFQVAIAPGNYTISQVLIISQNVALQGVGDVVGISFNVTKPVDAQASQPFYVMQFLNASFAAFTNIHFTSSPGIIGFESVSEVRITNCTFSYFTEGAVDIYNCVYPTIVNCIFQNNGPITAIKPQPYRGYSGGLSIGLSLNQPLGYDPAIHVSNCTFINNRAVIGPNLFQSSSNALKTQTFTGRGGGASILVNTFDPVYVSVEDCVFIHNNASSSAGGMFILLDGTSNDTIVVNRTVFFQNRGFISGSGALQLSFRDSGTLPRLHSVFVYNSEFIENSGIIGGAIYFRFTSFSSQDKGTLDYAQVKNCTFINNKAIQFGGAFAATSFVTMSYKAKNRTLDIHDCTFRGNKIVNSIGGILSIAYVSINFVGTNIFSENTGSTISLTVSIMSIINGGSLHFINNTNTGDVGGALYVSTLGKVILNDNIQVKFDGNSGRFGAAIVTDGYIPSTLQYTPYSSLCFVQHPEANPMEWASHNISFIFLNNNASVGSSVYMTNIGSCLSSDGYNETVQIFSLNFAHYQQNINLDYQGDVYNPQWNVQTPPISISVQNQSQYVSAYAGGKLKIYISVVSELGNPVSAVLRLSDTQTRNNNSLVLFNDLSKQAFDTEFHTFTNASDQHDIQIATIQQQTQYQTNFHISQQPCAFGYVLTPQSSGYLNCQCNSLNPAIANCSETTVQFTIQSGGLWANGSSNINAYGDTMTVYPCPMGYCHCSISEQAVGVICLFSVDTSNVNSQCDCQRTGVLCGDCNEGLGVSALLNECVTCGNASGLLIAGLTIVDAIAIILMVVVGASIPSWIQPCVFYLQLFPYMAEHFPVTFRTLHPYLYYVSSGLSFYFVYDFCLYPNMSPLVSYFIRYLPLFTAIIVCPITLAIRRRTSPRAPWHGLWWLVVLMYTHVVHTSMSILNCPRLPGSDGNTANVWYINGNIQCFTGWHLPLAISAILVLILCVAAIPIAAGTKMVPKLINKYIRNLSPTISENYKDGVEWFVPLELIRRMIAVLLIVAFPFNEHPSIFFIAIIMSLYGFIKPYKQMWSNVLEVALAVDAIIMLLLRNTEQLVIFQDLPENLHFYHYNNTDACTDNDDRIGLTPFVKILAPFYYIPLGTIVSGTALWFSVTLYKYAKLQSNTQKQVPTENDNGDIAEFQGWTAINRSVISTDQPLTEVSAP